MEALLIILGLVVLVAVIAIGIYNNLVKLRQVTKQAFADVDVQLKQRHDLVPNHVAAVNAHGVAEQAQAENLLSGALRQLFALAEAYPDLKANTNFLDLQNELSDIENKIAAARRFFNNAVAEFNTAVQQFPAVLFAGAMGFGAQPFFDLGEDRKTVEAAPQESFN